MLALPFAAAAARPGQRWRHCTQARQLSIHCLHHLVGQPAAGGLQQQEVDASNRR